MSSENWNEPGDIWLEAADPLGSRSAVIDSITKAILADYKSFDPSAGMVSSQWIQERVESYQFPQMEQDVQRAIKELFESNGIKIGK